MGTEGLALLVTAIGVSCFTVVFAVLFINYRKFAVAEINSGKRDIELIEQYFHDRQKSVIVRKKVLRVLKFVLYALLMSLITVCLVFAAFVRFSKNLPTGTKTLMVVATSSMSSVNPNNEEYINNIRDERKNYQFPQFSIIVLEKVDTSKLRQYDVVAYNHPSGRTYIHRIRAVEVAADGKITYRTRGDTNNADDQSTSEYNVVTTPNDVVGRYTGVYIPYIGAFVMFMQSLAGFVTVAALVFCLIMFDSNAGKITGAHTARTDYLIKILEVDNITEDSEISVDFVEKIYFDKVAYSLGSDGLVSREVAEEVLKNRPQEE